MMDELNRRFGAPVYEQRVLGAHGLVHSEGEAFIVHVVGVQTLAFGTFSDLIGARLALKRLALLGQQGGYEAIMRRALYTFEEVVGA